MVNYFFGILSTSDNIRNEKIKVVVTAVTSQYKNISEMDKIGCDIFMKKMSSPDSS
jgi:hypothetical protein